MTKDELREQFLLKRQQTPAAKADQLNNQLFVRFYTFFQMRSISNYHVFLPIKDKNEVDTWKIIQYLWVQGAKVVAPVVDFNTMTMDSYYIDSSSMIKENSWGIPEPVNATKASAADIEAVLVPLLAFDVHGQRVGYGKGFYDKFIAGLSDKVLKIGLSWFMPVNEISDASSRDIPLDFCVTPIKVFKFK